MIPPPPKTHRLAAAVSRFTHQLDRTNSYFQVVRRALPADDQDANVQYFFQTMILMVHTFLEEYYKHLVSTATFWQADTVRQYLMSRHQDQAAQIEELPLSQLTAFAADQVKFRNRAAKLKGILGVLFTTPPFADARAESKCLDLVKVRNVITHQGGFPDSETVHTIESQDVLLERDGALGGTFHLLHIRESFMRDALTEIGRSIRRIETELPDDPRYAI